MSRSRPITLSDRKLQDVQLRMRDQKSRLQRMIAQGTVAESDDDFLSEMYATLRELQSARRQGLCAKSR